MQDQVEFLYSRFLLSDGVSIDTRTLKDGDLFFAIKGPNFNGNDYAMQALNDGASYAVVDEDLEVQDPRIIKVKDSIEALQELAIFHRSRFKRTVIGLTGSNGKTTTKELLTEVLRKKFIVHSTIGNYNNHLGVPLTLLQIYPQVEIAIIEMGANHVGEIAELCTFARPNHGLITNIGKAHTETFGGIEGVLRGKSELFDFLKKERGEVFINMNDHRLGNMARRFEKYHAYPEDDVLLVESNPFLRIKIGSTEVDTHLVGKYNFENICAAVCLGRYFEVPDNQIADAIAKYQPTNLRSQLIEKDRIRVILDAYNANPDSMKLALENLASVGGEKLAVLGEMNELENEEKEHKEITETIVKLDLAAILIGDRFKGSLEGSSKIIWFKTKEEASAYLEDKSWENFTLLLKASRTIKLETLVENIF